MSTIFISHSSRDADLAVELGRRLAEQHHHSVFLDLDPERGIVAGQSWEQTLYRKLRACRVVIALCTDHYLASQWCFAEIALARMEGKRMVALQGDPLDASAKLPSILTEGQFIDLREDPDEAYQRLWRALEVMDLVGVVGEWDPRRPPYLGLDAYQEEHAPVFFGREDEARDMLELVARGAPGLILVLGASGSGKSSLVRAGVVPRLRREVGRWLVVDPFRPGRDPFCELAESLARAFRRHAPEHAAQAGNAEKIRARLEAWTSAELLPAEGVEATVAIADGRLTRLMEQLHELQRDPPEPVQERVRHFLDWSLEDLRRICDVRSPSAQTSAATTPGTTPLLELARELQRASGQRDARVLLIVDQFEELLARDGAGERTERFLALLRATLEVEHDHCPLMVIGTMRSDFLGAFQRNAALRGVDFESLSLGPMKLEGMRRVIEAPARLGAIELESGLADRLLEATETPDALPLLSFTLWVLWRDCHADGKLALADYERLGGLDGAVAREADALLAAARREDKEAPLRAAFLHMARLTEEGNYARRPVPWDAEQLAPVHPTLERFVERRLLVSRDEGGTRTVEVAHEALLRSWQPLVTWLDDHRAELLLKQQLRRDAATWQASARAVENLWRGGRLQDARELLRAGELDEAEGRFVRAGLRRRRTRRLTLAAATLSIIAVLAVFLGIALQQAEKARQESRRAELGWIGALTAASRGLVAARSVDELQALGRALRAALVLEEVSDPPADLCAEVRRTLQNVLNDVRERNRLPVQDSILTAAFSADGQRLAAVGRDGNVYMWDRSGRPVTTFRVSADECSMDSASFSADLGRLVTLHSKMVNGAVQVPSERELNVWDVEVRQPQAAARYTATEWSVAMAPDGRAFATAGSEGLSLWDLTNRALPLPERTAHASEALRYVVFGPDSETFATVSASTFSPLTPNVPGRPSVVRIWNLQGAELGELVLESEVDSVRFTPDSLYLIADGRLWTRDGIPIRALDRDFISADLMWGAGTVDGVPIASYFRDAPREFRGHGTGQALCFDPASRLLVTAGGDRSVRLWDLEPRYLAEFPDRSTRFELMHEMVVSSDAEFFAAACTVERAPTITIWNRAGEILADLPRGTGFTLVSLSPDGRQVAAVEDSASAVLWDWRERVQVSSYTSAAGSWIQGVAFEGERSLVVEWNQDASAMRLQDWEHVERASFATPAETLIRAHVSSDGNKIVVTATDGVGIWDLAGERVAFFPALIDSTESAIASRDTRRIAITSRMGGMRVHDRDGLRFVVPGRHALRFSPDGSLLAAIGNPFYKVTLLDVESELPVADYPASHGANVRFSADGTSLVLVGSNVTPRLWPVLSLEELIAHGCDRMRDYLESAPELDENGRWLRERVRARETPSSASGPAATSH